MDTVARLRAIIARNSIPIDGYGMQGVRELFASFDSLPMRKRQAAATLLNLHLGRPYVTPRLRPRTTARALAQTREYLRG